MIFDESDAKITELMTGRTIDHVIRNGKELEFVCNDGHICVIQADVDGDIHLKRVDVRLYVGQHIYGSQILD